MIQAATERRVVRSRLRSMLTPLWWSRSRRKWEAEWSSEDFSPPWGDRGVSRQIVEAVDTGWLPKTGRVLDIGCGLGEVAGWFAQRGYEAVGIDIAASAIHKACEKHGGRAPAPRFVTLDICRSRPPGFRYDIFIDRGCLHQISENRRPRYVRHLEAVAADDARMLLFIRAFRGDRPYADPEETPRHVRWVRETFEDVFDVERHAPTYLDRDHGQNPANALPGIVFWLTRTGRRDKT